MSYSSRFILLLSGSIEIFLKLRSLKPWVSIVSEIIAPSSFGARAQFESIYILRTLPASTSSDVSSEHREKYEEVSLIQWLSVHSTFQTWFLKKKKTLFLLFLRASISFKQIKHPREINPMLAPTLCMLSLIKSAKSVVKWWPTTPYPSDFSYKRFPTCRAAKLFFFFLFHGYLP